MNVSTPSHLAYVAQISLGIVFLLSALPKLRRPRAFVQNVVEYEVLPDSVARVFGLALVPLEAILVVAFLTGWLVNIALPLAVVLLVAFLVAVGLNLRRGRRLQCGCFGSASEQISSRTLARLFLLLVVTLVLIGYRSIGDASLPRVGSTTADRSTLAYAVESVSLSAFVVLFVAWMLSLPELTLLTRQLRWAVLSSGATNSGDGAKGVSHVDRLLSFLRRALGPRDRT
ncbi:MAG: MauE/DoxX family redox-associated membrane protein [Thermomicrobiales bacterium]